MDAVSVKLTSMTILLLRSPEDAYFAGSEAGRRAPGQAFVPTSPSKHVAVPRAMQYVHQLSGEIQCLSKHNPRQQNSLQTRIVAGASQTLRLTSVSRRLRF